MTIDIGSQKNRPQDGAKTNPEYKQYGTKDGQIEFGRTNLAQNGKESDVTSGVYIQAFDTRHYCAMDIDGPRKGWTSNRCPGPYQIWCASDDAGNNSVTDPIGGSWPGVGFFLLAENGDIVIRAPKGRIRMSAMDIDIRAEGPNPERGSINLDSNESVNIKTGTFDVIADKAIKLYTPKTFQILANVSCSIVSNFVTGLTAASEYKPDKSNLLTQATMILKQDYLA